MQILSNASIYPIYFGNRSVSTNKDLSFEDFIKCCNAIDTSNTRLNNINGLISKSLIPVNHLGSGTQQTAYSLNNIENYVVKIPNDGFRPGDIKKVEDEFPKINLGQAVAIIGNAKICKKQKGIISSIPYRDRITGSKNNLNTYLSHIKRTAGLNQAAYDDFALTLSELNKKEMLFDCFNPNNVLIDESDQKINIVDDLTDFPSDDDSNNALSMIASLLDIRYMAQVPNREEIIPYWQKIINKCNIAANKVNLPAPNKDLSSLKYALKTAEFEQERFS